MALRPEVERDGMTTVPDGIDGLVVAPDQGEADQTGELEEPTDAEPGST